LFKKGTIRPLSLRFEPLFVNNGKDCKYKH
jgi:hypothetical protein